MHFCDDTWPNSQNKKIETNIVGKRHTLLRW